MKIRILNHGLPTLAAAAAAIAVFATASAGAATLLSSDFVGVDKSDTSAPYTATNISWTTDGLTLTSTDLTFTDPTNGGDVDGFHDVTADEIDVNHNMTAGGWQTSMVFNVDAGTTLELATLTAGMRLTNGTGGDQANTGNKLGQVGLEIVGSSSGSLGTVDLGGDQSYPTLVYTRELDLSGFSALDDSETYTFVFSATGSGWGHHKSLQSFAVSGTTGIPEPASLALLGLGLAGLGLRRRRR